MVDRNREFNLARKGMVKGSLEDYAKEVSDGEMDGDAL